MWPARAKKEREGAVRAPFIRRRNPEGERDGETQRVERDVARLTVSRLERHRQPDIVWTVAEFGSGDRSRAEPQQESYPEVVAIHPAFASYCETTQPSGREARDGAPKPTKDCPIPARASASRDLRRSEVPNRERDRRIVRSTRHPKGVAPRSHDSHLLTSLASQSEAAHVQPLVRSQIGDRNRW